jgi:hypothetical protein
LLLCEILKNIQKKYKLKDDTLVMVDAADLRKEKGNTQALFKKVYQPLGFIRQDNMGDVIEGETTLEMIINKCKDYKEDFEKKEQEPKKKPAQKEPTLYDLIYKTFISDVDLEKINRLYIPKYAKKLKNLTVDETKTIFINDILKKNKSLYNNALELQKLVNSNEDIDNLFEKLNNKTEFTTKQILEIITNKYKEDFEKKQVNKKTEEPKKEEPKKKAPKKLKKEEPKKNSNIGEKLQLFLNYLKSPSKRGFNYLLNTGFNGDIIDSIKSNMKLSDFYPTPQKCVEEASEYIKDSSNIIDPACGLGFPLHYINEINPKAKLHGIEFNLVTAKVAQEIWKNSDVEIKRGDFFDIPFNNTYDYYFLNPPFTSGFSKKDNYYIKFILYLGLLLDNSKVKTIYSQLVFPTRFLKEVGYKPDDIVNLADVLLKVPMAELKRYFEQLDFFNKLDIDINEYIKEYKKDLEKAEKYNIKDVYSLILSDLFTGEIIYLSDCKFETTKFQIANLMFIRRK